MIVDASAVVPRLIETEFTQAAEIMTGWTPLRAPIFIKVEIAQTLWKYQRAGRIAASDVIQGHAAVDDLINILVPFDTLLDPAIRLALDLNHSVYDCLYLALALDTGEGIVTADKRLAALARGLLIETHLIEAAS